MRSIDRGEGQLDAASNEITGDAAGMVEAAKAHRRVWYAAKTVARLRTQLSPKTSPHDLASSSAHFYARCVCV
jgi:hypothetical protein